jgi:FKBP-type peptidyl-prolyl cis-trans isomerase
MKNTSIAFVALLFIAIIAQSCNQQPKIINTMPWDIKTTDTITTESGLKYLVVKKSNNPTKAEKGMMVDVHYTGFLTDGKVFDSSIERGNPISFELGTGSVIKGWDEGIALMNIGDKYRLIIPADLGYGTNGAGSDIPPNATLLFDVELVNVR